MNLEIDDLKSQEEFLAAQLAAVDPDDSLTRASIESCLNEIRTTLDSLPAPPRRASARLTFRGQPVIAAHGIVAEFGSKATAYFAEAVTKVAASMIHGPLASRGRIPDRGAGRLLITGTAIGSFGFELQEFGADTPSLFDDGSTAHDALIHTICVLENTLQSDEDLADSLVPIDQRSVNAIRAFLEYVAANQATCAIEHDKRSFRFMHASDVARAASRLEHDLHEESSEVAGSFIGMLPTGRTFEFVAADDPNTVIRGKVGNEIDDPDEINRHLRQETTVRLTSKRIGSGRPRYVLTHVPPWGGGPQVPPSQ